MSNTGVLVPTPEAPTGKVHYIFQQLEGHVKDTA